MNNDKFVDLLADKVKNLYDVFLSIVPNAFENISDLTPKKYSSITKSVLYEQAIDDITDLIKTRFNIPVKFKLNNKLQGTIELVSPDINYYTITKALYLVSKDKHKKLTIYEMLSKSKDDIEASKIFTSLITLFRNNELKINDESYQLLSPIKEGNFIIYINIISAFNKQLDEFELASLILNTIGHIFGMIDTTQYTTNVNKTLLESYVKTYSDTGDKIKSFKIALKESNLVPDAENRSVVSIISTLDKDIVKYFMLEDNSEGLLRFVEDYSDRFMVDMGISDIYLKAMSKHAHGELQTKKGIIVIIREILNLIFTVTIVILGFLLGIFVGLFLVAVIVLSLIIKFILFIIYKVINIFTKPISNDKRSITDRYEIMRLELIQKLRLLKNSDKEDAKLLTEQIKRLDDMYKELKPILSYLDKRSHELSDVSKLNLTDRINDMLKKLENNDVYLYVNLIKS